MVPPPTNIAVPPAPTFGGLCLLSAFDGVIVIAFMTSVLY